MKLTIISVCDKCNVSKRDEYDHRPWKEISLPSGWRWFHDTKLLCDKCYETAFMKYRQEMDKAHHQIVQSCAAKDS